MPFQTKARAPIAVVRSRAGLTLAVAALVTAAVRAELLRLVLVLRRLLPMR